MNLGDRMKTYERITKTRLIRRMPVIIRLDGKAFHTFTKGFKKPFDPIITKCMQETVKFLVENVQGCILGYTQSDEISLLLKDWQTHETNAWFDNDIQKIVSISSSMATYQFNKILQEEIKDVYPNLVHKVGFFDSRCFNLTKEEVNNYFLWRQQDGVRNSIQALACSLYSHKQIMNINTKALQDKMFSEKGVNWNELSTELKRGSCYIKKDSSWTLDREIPIFSIDRDYIESLLD